MHSGLLEGSAGRRFQLPVSIPDEIPRTSRVAGVASGLAIDGYLAVVAQSDPESPSLLLIAAVVLSHYAVAIWFSAVGFRRRVRWMLIWLSLFFLLFPPATVIFWMANRQLDFKLTE